MLAASFSFLCQLKGVRLSDGWNLARDGLVLTFRREEGNFFHRNSILGLNNGVSMGHLQRDVADILAPLLDAKMVLIKGLVETRLPLFLSTLEPIISLSRKLVGRPYSMDGSRRWGSRVYDCRCSILSGHSKWTREDFQKVYKEMSDSGFSPKWDEYETSDYKSDHWIDGL